jgi:hypothetical protein
LAYQLGQFDYRLGSTIAKAIEEVPSIKQASLRCQFQTLLVELFTTINDCLGVNPILIIIDALDESGQPSARKEPLNVLALESPRPPPTVRFFIASCVKSDVRNAFGTRPYILVRQIDIRTNPL